MGKIAVIYKSRYGGAKQYAKWIASALEADLFPLDKHTSGKLGDYSVVIYGAGLYAGSISGFPLFKEIFKRHNDKRFILYTVGLIPAESTETYKALTDRVFNSEMHAKIKAFHFRGGIDYNSLTFIHRMMIRMLAGILSKKKPQTLSDDEKCLISAYGKTVNYADESAIEPLLVYVLSLNQNT